MQITTDFFGSLGRPPGQHGAPRERQLECWKAMKRWAFNGIRTFAQSGRQAGARSA